MSQPPQDAQHYQMLIEALPDCVVLVGLDGKLLLANQAAAALYGCDTIEELLSSGKSAFDLIAQEDLSRTAESMRQTIEQGTVRNLEYTLLTKDGRRYPAEVSVSVLRDDQGNPSGFLSVIRDVSERKQTEMSLRESEAKYAAVVEQAKDVVVIVQNGVCKFVNPAIACLGYTPEEMTGRPFIELVAPGFVELITERYQARVAGEDLQNVYAVEVLHKDGSTVEVEGTVTRIEYQDQPALLAIVRDVSERYRAEQALRESEELFRSLAEKSPNMIFINQAGRIVYANEQCARMMEYNLDELTDAGFDFRRLIAPRSAKTVQEKYARHMQGQEILPYEYALLTKSGREIEVINATRLITFRGKPAILGIVTDISESKRTEKALRESEARYRSLVETLPDGLTVTDLSGKIIMTNDQGARLYGVATAEEALAEDKNIFDHIVPEEHEQAVKYMQQLLEAGTIRQLELTLTRKDGSTYPVEISASAMRDEASNPTGLIGVVRDITERKQAEEERRRLQSQILHAQKLESLGVLAGGIAHDFNNLLMGVLGNVSLSLLEVQDGSPVRHYLKQIEKTGQHAAELTNQMLAYSGKGKFVVKPVNISEQVDGMIHLLKVSISKKVALRCDLETELPTIDADATQIRQVIMNLITNAAESTGESGGSVIVRTGLAQCDRIFLSESYLDEDLPEGEYVVLEVADSGCGMDPQTRAKIFDPFFTTKFTGRGLGLAAVLGIVRGHHGAIRVTSTPGQGSSFQVLFPRGRLREAAPAERPASVAPPMADGKVLVIDDEEAVRDVTRNMLENSGFCVLVAKNGQEGLDLFKRQANEIALVLLDNTMPVMDGEEVFRRLRQIKSDIRVILSSGFTEQEATSRFAGKGLAAFIQKPYRLDQLNSILCKVLEDQP